MLRQGLSQQQSASAWRVLCRSHGTVSGQGSDPGRLPTLPSAAGQPASLHRGGKGRSRGSSSPTGSGGGTPRLDGRDAGKRDTTSPSAASAAAMPAALAAASAPGAMGALLAAAVGSVGSASAAEAALFFEGSGSGFARHSYRSLVLDSAYRPINVASWFRAFSMAFQERAEVVSFYPDGFAWSGSGQHPLAAVIRVYAYVDLNEINSKVACNRRNVMIRDRYTCAYCGSHHDLTLDHVSPISRGGKDSWSNLVTACTTCNQRKGSHTLTSLGWRLKKAPWEPTPWELGVVAGLTPSDVESPNPEWDDYLAPYRTRLDSIRKAREVAGEEDH